MEKVASDNARILRDVLFKMIEDRGHSLFEGFTKGLRHAPFYEVPFTEAQIIKESGRDREAFDEEEIVRWMEEEEFIVYPGRVPTLLAVPSTLYAVADVDSDARGVPTGALPRDRASTRCTRGS